MKFPNDTPIESLDLKKRTYHLLKRMKIDTVSQLIIHFEAATIKYFKGVGKKTLKEIDSSLSNYQKERPQIPSSPPEKEVKNFTKRKHREDKTPITELDLTITHYSILENSSIKTIGDIYSVFYDSTETTLKLKHRQIIKAKLKDYLERKEQHTPFSNNQITDPEDKYLLPIKNNETPLEYLNLSVRPFNSLQRSGVTTVGELSSLILGKNIYKVKNIGEKSVKEIKKKIKEFGKNPEKFSSQSHIIADINSNNLSKSFIIDVELLKKVATLPLENILIDRLILSEDLKKILEADNIRAIGDFPIQYHQHIKYANVKLRLEQYLYWMINQDQEIWELEAENKRLSPLHFVLLNRMTLDNLVKKWLHPLNDEEKHIIRSCYGIIGEAQTLEETGNDLGKTRERIRQIQKRALAKLQKPKSWMEIEPLVALYLDWIKTIGGLINKAQISKYTSLIVAKSGISSVGVCSLIFDLEKKIKWLRDTEAWALNNYPLEKTHKIQKQFERILVQEKTGLPKRELFRRFRSSEIYTNNSQKVPPNFFVSCLNVNPNIEVDEDELFKLTKWSGKRLDEMILALREIGEPAHYTLITDQTNALLPADQQATERQIHAHMGRLPNIFVRVGHGIFGLAEWGLVDDGNVANAVVRILTEENQLLTLDVITSKVLENWRVNPGSVHMAIVNDARITRWDNEQCGLAEWNIERSKSQEEDLLSWFDEWLED
jgi:DNA-directed RNA polymerase alpha subunit